MSGTFRRRKVRIPEVYLGKENIGLQIGFVVDDRKDESQMGPRLVSCRKTPQRVAWLERLPDVLRDLEHRWSLTLDAPFDDEVRCAPAAAAV